MAEAETTPTAAPDLAPGRAVSLAIVSLLAASFMLYQFAVLRELRFQLNTIFTLTPFLFSSVLVFIGLGSLLAARLKDSAIPVLRACLLSLPLLTLLLFAATIRVPQLIIDRSSPTFGYVDVHEASPGERGDPYLSSVLPAFLAVGIAGYGPIFFLQGLAFALFFHHGRRHGVLGNVYGVDLIASGWGALLGGGLAFVMPPAHQAMVASFLLVVSLWVSARYFGIRPWWAAAVTVATLFVVVGAIRTDLPQRLEAPLVGTGEITNSIWSCYRRIDVVESPVSTQIFTDGLLFQGYLADNVPAPPDPRMFPMRLLQKGSPVESILVMGAGSGADVRLLRRHASPDLRIVAVELDAGFVEVARALPWLWSAYRTAEIIIQEGRYFLETTSQTFDMVLYAYIDPQSAISSVGLPDANFLYTSSGLARAYGRVNAGGYLVITRVFLVDEEDLFVSALCATLRAAGIPQDEVGLYRAPGVISWGPYGRLSTFHAVVHKGGAPPDMSSPTALPEKWRDGGRPTTDAYPMSMGTRTWLARTGRFVASNGLALGLLLLLGVGLSIKVATNVAYLNFFLLGFGSFLLESLVLYNSFLLLGDPNLSASVAVGMLLFFGGIGSLVSPRLHGSRTFLALTPVLVLAYAVTAPALNGATIAMPVSVRALVFAAHLAVAAFVAGVMFPLALRSFLDADVSRMFFIDLVGCALGPVAFWLGLAFVGIPVVWAGAAGAYAVVGLILARRG